MRLLPAAALRDALAATAGGVGIQWLFTTTSVVMLLLAPVYGLLVARLRKHLLLPAVYLFFAANLLLFHALFDGALWPDWTARAFFVWLSVFNMFAVSVFWSFMADLLPTLQAERLFGPVAAGGSAGAILGPLLTHALVGPVGAAGLTLLAALMIAATTLCIVGLRRCVACSGASAGTVSAGHRVGGSAWAGFTAVGRSRFLLAIGAVVLLGSLAATWMYLEVLHLAGERYPDAAARTRFFARLDLVVNVAALLLQLFVTPWLVRRFGIVAGLVLLPSVAFGSFLWVAAAPALMTLAWTQVLRRVLEFGAARPTREMLYTAVDEETRFKAKNFIDTAVQRVSDTVSAWLHALLQNLGVAAGGLGLICAGIMLGVTALAAWLASEFARMPLRAGTCAAQGRLSGLPRLR